MDDFDAALMHISALGASLRVRMVVSKKWPINYDAAGVNKWKLLSPAAITDLALILTPSVCCGVLAGLSFGLCILLSATPLLGYSTLHLYLVSTRMVMQLFSSQTWIALVIGYSVWWIFKLLWSYPKLCLEFFCLSITCWALYIGSYP